MKKLIENEVLEIKYLKGNGAWTYHLVIPNTKEIEGKWGSIKVSGSIDAYCLEKMNLAPRKDTDKMISLNKNIRSFLKKSEGDTVEVTLYLHEPTKNVDKEAILNSLKDAAVLKKFKSLSIKEQAEIFTDILSQKSEEKQIDTILKVIEKFH